MGVVLVIVSAMPTDKKKEIYTYQAPWVLYAMNWSLRRDQKFRLAVGSFIEKYTTGNTAEILPGEGGKGISAYISVIVKVPFERSAGLEDSKGDHKTREPLSFTD